jgi:DNA uptake protein ComE-like DNA-binding protein
VKTAVRKAGFVRSVIALVFVALALCATSFAHAGVLGKLKALAKKHPVDLNSAPVEELKHVPRLGDEIASRIVAGRPYADKSELVSKNIVPQAVYDQIKDYVIAKPPHDKQ